MLCGPGDAHGASCWRATGAGMRGTGACADGKDWGVEEKFPGVAAYGHPPEGDGSRCRWTAHWLRCIRTLRARGRYMGPRAIGKSRGGWTITVHKIADDAHCCRRGVSEIPCIVTPYQGTLTSPWQSAANHPFHSEKHAVIGTNQPNKHRSRISTAQRRMPLS